MAPFEAYAHLTLAMVAVRRQESGKRLDATRIVFVVAGEVLGGAERNAIDLAGRFAKIDGATVHIVALDSKAGRARRVATEEGISWTSVPTPWVGSRLARFLSLLRVAMALRRLRPDVLLPRTNLPNVVCGLTWRFTGAKFCIWNQCDVLGTKRFSQKLFRWALHATPLAVTTAFHTREWMAQQWGFPPERVHVIRSEVRLPDASEGRAEWRARLVIGEDDFAACMLGHLHPGKDHATLLRAWRLVVDHLRCQGRAAFLLLAGRPAGSEDEVKALAFDLDLRNNVRLLGEVGDVAGLLLAADLAVFSSRSECLGRGATEPMCAGLAVVATDIAGIREAVGEPGLPYLAPPGDAEGLAEAILTLARDPTVRARLGKTNAELIGRRQSDEVTSAQYAELIARTLRTRGRERNPSHATTGTGNHLIGV